MFSPVCTVESTFITFFHRFCEWSGTCVLTASHMARNCKPSSVVTESDRVATEKRLQEPILQAKRACLVPNKRKILLAAS